jgi:hypothetical protein
VSRASCPRRPRRAATLSLATVAVAVIFVAGCGRPAVLDVERSEARIRERLSETYDVDVAAVTCPDEVDVEAGATFTCRARVSGSTVAVDVRQRDDEGALDVAPNRAVLVARRVATDIAEVLADRFDRDDVAVRCPGDPVRIEEPGATFTCTAVDGEETKEVEVRVRDAQGALTYTLR